MAWSDRTSSREVFGSQLVRDDSVAEPVDGSASSEPAAMSSVRRAGPSHTGMPSDLRRGQLLRDPQRDQLRQADGGGSSPRRRAQQSEERGAQGDGSGRLQTRSRSRSPSRGFDGETLGGWSSETCSEACSEETSQNSVVWNMFDFPLQLGISSSRLTKSSNLFQRARQKNPQKTINQIIIS